MLPDDFHVERVDSGSATVLRNLFEHYLHDMAEWFQFDTGEDGRYSHSVESYWDAEGEVYLAYAQSIPIGFALIASGEPYTGKPDTRDLKDFFVVRRHRRSGVGQALANHVWAAHRGPWVVRVYRGNVPALPFWRRTVASFGGSDAVEETRVANDKQWSYFHFVSQR